MRVKQTVACHGNSARIIDRLKPVLLFVTLLVDRLKPVLLPGQGFVEVENREADAAERGMLGRIE